MEPGNRVNEPEETYASYSEQERNPRPKFDLETHLDRQFDFSQQTFGPGFIVTGIMDHIRKELTEIEKDPFDLSEWIDVIILALDGAMRAGYTSREVINALVAKQTKNENRKWPDWRTADRSKAIEHDRSAD
jgi:Protein of unknown function (DUF550)